MDDQELRRVVELLREPVAPDPAALERTKAAVRARAPARRLARLLRWLTAPRPVHLSPLRVAGALSVVALAALLAGRALPDSGAAWEPAAVAAEPSSVRFVFLAEGARSVSVVGDFNDWDPRATPLQPAGRGVWVASVPLSEGRYVYSFVVDGTEWMRDPVAPAAPEDDFGRPNSVLLVARRSL